ncbi:MAG: hypothetical protein B6242_08795 [Anaerolineaceae bacterium 4572_78]|nr:MAG: hypothetical protein B6242_08795 [Anaerolineaceae bacterium 4572_78]
MTYLHYYPKPVLSGKPNHDYAIMDVSDGSRLNCNKNSVREINKVIPQLIQSDTVTTYFDIVVIIPAYNEAEHIADVVRQSSQYADEVIVVDDGSKDNTAEIAEKAGASVIRHQRNQGKGVALTTGFEVVRHLIGSRYLDNHSDVPLHRILGHWVFNFITNQTSGTFVTDSQSGFRAFSSEAISKIRFKSTSFSVESEMQFLANDYNLKVTEVPITILYEDPPKRHVIVHGLIVLNGIAHMVWHSRPFYVLGVPGLILQMISLLLLVLSTNAHFINMVMCMMLFIVGALAFFSGLVLHLTRKYFFRFVIS